MHQKKNWKISGLGKNTINLENSPWKVNVQKCILVECVIFINGLGACLEYIASSYLSMVVPAFRVKNNLCFFGVKWELNWWIILNLLPNGQFLSWHSEI